MMYDPIAMRRADLQRQIADAQRQLDTIQMVPNEDAYQNGAVIRAEIRVGTADPATYLFLKIVRPLGDASLADPTRWYHTGFIAHSSNPQHGRRQNDPFFYSWRELQTWLIDRGRVVESWEFLETRCELDHSAEPCTLKHLTFPRAHEDVIADILDVLRFEYGGNLAETAGIETKHMRVIGKIMKIEGVYE